MKMGNMRNSFGKIFAALVFTYAASLSCIWADAVSYDGKIYGYDEGDIDWGATAQLFYDSQICNHLEIGLRFAKHTLDKPTKYDEKTELAFIGTISELKEDDSFSLYPVITYGFNDWFGIGFTWDSLTATAHTAHTLDKHNDGTFSTKGPTFTGILTIPGILDSKLIPYAELGFNHASASFDPEYWWEYGYGSPEHYKSAGCPKDGKLYNNKHRAINTKAGTKFGLVYGFGIKYYIIENLCLDLSYRHVNADAKCDFFYKIAGVTVFDAGYVTLPLDYSVIEFGLRYAF